MPVNVTATIGLDSPKLVGDCGEYSIGGGSSSSQRLMMLRPSAPYRLPSSPSPHQRRPINMRYSKMHGLGNDFIVVRLPAVHVEELKAVSVRPGDAPTFQHPDMVLGGNGGGVLGGGGIRALSDRKRGIGCDQFIVYARRRRRERPAASVAAALAAMSKADAGTDSSPTDNNDANNTTNQKPTPLSHLREELLMWVFNGPTGEEVGMCGNALRCVALHYILGHDDVDCFEPVVSSSSHISKTTAAVEEGSNTTAGTMSCRGAANDDLWVGGPRAELPFFERHIMGSSGIPTLCAELDVRVVQPNRTIRCTIDIPHSWADTAPIATTTTSSLSPSPASTLRFLPDFKRHLLKSRLYTETTTTAPDVFEEHQQQDTTTTVNNKPLVVTVHMGPPTKGSLAVLYPPSYPSATQHFLHKDPSTRPQNGGDAEEGSGGVGGYGKYLSRVVRSNKKANRTYLNAKLAEEAAQLTGISNKTTNTTSVTTTAGSTTSGSTSVFQPSPPPKRADPAQLPPPSPTHTKQTPALHPETILYNPVRIQSQLWDLVVGTETFEAPTATTTGPTTSVSFSFTAFGDDVDDTSNQNNIKNKNDDEDEAAKNNSILASYIPRLHPRSRPMNAFSYRTDMFVGYIMSQLQAFSGLSDLELTVEGGGVDVGGGGAAGASSSSSSSDVDDGTNHAASSSRHHHQQPHVKPTFTRQQAKRAYLNLQDLLFANAVRLVTMVDFGNPHLVILIDFAACRFKELAQLVELSGRELLQYESKRTTTTAGGGAPLSVVDLRKSMFKLDASLRRHSIGGGSSRKSFGRAASMFVNGDVETRDELIKLLTQAQQDLQLELRIREKEQKDRLQRIRERYNITNPNVPNTTTTTDNNNNTTTANNTTSSIPLEFDDSFVHCIGETIEKYCPLLFPKGANVEIAFVRHEGERFYVPNPDIHPNNTSAAGGGGGPVRTADRDASVVRMRVWERGAGITEACGSGACAVGVATYAHNRAPMQTVVLDGGVLMIGVSADEVVGNRVNPDTGRMYGLTEAIDDDDGDDNNDTTPIGADVGGGVNPDIEGRGAPPKVTRRTLDDLLGDLHSQSSSLSSSMREDADDAIVNGDATTIPATISPPPPTPLPTTKKPNDDDDDDLEGEGLNANYQPFVIQNVTMAGEATFVAAGTTSFLV